MAMLHFAGVSNSDVDNYGFKKPEDFDEEAFKSFLSDYLPVLARRSKRWDSLGNSLENGELTSSSDAKMKRFIRKGIPVSLRPKVWYIASGALQRERQDPDFVLNLLKQPLADDVENAIDLDLHRTFPDNEYFREMSLGTLEQLRIILRCIALSHPELGYCQGFNYIGGMLLLVLKDHEKAFWLMDTAVSWVSDYYAIDMRGIKRDSLVIEHYISQRVPKVAELFKRCDFHLPMITTKWLVCWFLETLPIETVLRIWDCFFNEGMKVLIRVSVGLILMNSNRFLECRNFADITDLFSVIVTEPDVLDCHRFMENIHKATSFLKTADIKKIQQKFSK